MSGFDWSRVPPGRDNGAQWEAYAPGLMSAVDKQFSKGHVLGIFRDFVENKAHHHCKDEIPRFARTACTIELVNKLGDMKPYFLIGSGWSSTDGAVCNIRFDKC
jgi:hypothetical protein